MDIEMRQFGCGWGSKWKCPLVRPYVMFVIAGTIQMAVLSNHYQVLHVVCRRLEKEPYWFWVMRTKVKVDFGRRCDCNVQSAEHWTIKWILIESFQWTLRIFSGKVTFNLSIQSKSNRCKIVTSIPQNACMGQTNALADLIFFYKKGNFCNPLPFSGLNGEK